MLIVANYRSAIGKDYIPRGTFFVVVNINNFSYASVFGEDWVSQYKISDLTPTLRSGHWHRHSQWSPGSEDVNIGSTDADKTFSINISTKILMPLFVVSCGRFVTNNLAKVCKISTCPCYVNIGCFFDNTLLRCCSGSATVDGIDVGASHARSIAY